MVYYHTSGGIKMMRNILLEYASTYEITPYEYMKTYIENCPETTQDSKLSWIAETFLGIQKHYNFLKDVSLHMSQELNEEDQQYFIIILHAITFQIEPKDSQCLYKCMFNLSKPFLQTYTRFLSNNEILAYIAQLAQAYYDTSFITENIIRPLFQWQPYISEMAHTYEEYLKKVGCRKLKPLTKPIQPNVLNRKGKKTRPRSPQKSVTYTPLNTVMTKSKKMLTKSIIDQKLKDQHEKNKQRAEQLLNDVKNKTFHFAQIKSEKYYKTISNIKNETEKEFNKTFPKSSQSFSLKLPSLYVKDTAASLKRMNKHIQKAEEEEIKWLENVIKCCNNTIKIEEIEEIDRQEREKERQIDIEKKHIMGQITHEEALLAKKKLQEENKKRYEEFLIEKEALNKEIENWRTSEIEKNRKTVEKLSLLELDLIQAKNGVVMKKKKAAAELKEESKLALAEAMTKKKEELEQKIRMIKEIKILAMIAKKASVPKIIDLTETSGFGFLCEMSLAELQERLNAMKIGLQEELENKKNRIRNAKIAEKQELENTRKIIQDFKTERAAMRTKSKKSKITVDISYSKEIEDLRKTLEEKRRQRINMCN